MFLRRRWFMSPSRTTAQTLDVGVCVDVCVGVCASALGGWSWAERLGGRPALLGCSKTEHSQGLRLFSRLELT